jgi:hypothetical protein
MNYLQSLFSKYIHNSIEKYNNNNDNFYNKLDENLIQDEGIFIFQIMEMSNYYYYKMKEDG